MILPEWTGLALQGLGAVAGAWGQYESGKKQAEIENKKLEYQMGRDALADGKAEQAQSNLENAFLNSDMTQNKKKKKTTDTPLLNEIQPVVV